MPFLAPIGAAIAGAAGASAGTAGLIGAGASALGSGIAGAIGGAGGGNIQTAGQRLQLQNLADTQNLVNQGAGGSDVAAGAQSQRDLAAALQQAQTQGFNPNEQDIQGANSLANQLFRQRQVGLEQNFMQQQQQFNQQAALQGRNPLDPVFRNKLAQEQTRQQQQLQAEQGVFATQYALQQPQQRLQLQAQRANVLGGLATQALANRQALASMGNQAAGIQAQGQGAGGFLGGLAGGISGLGRGLQAGQAFLTGLDNNRIQTSPVGSGFNSAVDANRFSVGNTLGAFKI